MDIVYLILTGACVGFLSSFFGIGGGSLIMPILYMLYPGLPAQAIIPSSLGVIFLNTIINNYNFYKMQLSPSKNTILNFAITCSVGAGLGAYGIHYVDSVIIKKLFAILMFIIALKVLLSKTHNKNKKLEEDQFKIGGTGFLGSLISSITGLGGGIIFVPMLVSFVKVPLTHISSYSNAAMSFATLIGIIPHFYYPFASSSQDFYNQGFVGHVNFIFIFLIFSGSLISSKFGAKLNTSIDYRFKKVSLALLLIIFALKTLI